MTAPIQKSRTFVAALLATLSLLFALASVADATFDARPDRPIELALRTLEAPRTEGRIGGYGGAQTTDCSVMHYTLATRDLLLTSTRQRETSEYPIPADAELSGAPQAVLVPPPILRS